MCESLCHASGLRELLTGRAAGGWPVNGGNSRSGGGGWSAGGCTCRATKDWDLSALLLNQTVDALGGLVS